MNWAAYERRQKKLRFFLFGGAIFICFLIFGYWILTMQKREAVKDARQQLDLIARQKVSAIESWRLDQLEDAQTLAASPLFKRLVKRIAAEDAKKESEEDAELLQLFAESNDIEDILLLDPRGRVLRSIRGISPKEDAYRSVLGEALRTRSPAMSDLHRDESYPFPHLSTVTPVFSGPGEEAPLEAVLLMIHHAGEFLYPLLHSWPLPSDTAEAFLVRKEGDEVLLLSELRHRRGATMSLRLPLKQAKLPAAAGLSGHVGAFEGLDYRGRKVVSIVLPVPGSSWVMVTKVDSFELYAGWYRRAWLILGLLSASFLVVAFAGFFLWQRLLKHHYKDMYDMESSLRSRLERDSVVLKSIDDAVIAADGDGRISMFNSMAEKLTGWEAKEAMGRQVTEVLHIVDETSLQRQEDAVVKVLREGAAVAFDSHTLLIDRKGDRRHVADSAFPIRDAAGAVVGVVNVFRDRSKEREMERERDITIALLQIINQAGDLKGLIRETCALVQRVTGCEAVGIRCPKGDDCPFLESRGYPPGFVEGEGSFCDKDQPREAMGEDRDNPLQGCICRKVILGRFNPALPYFTPNGSFWTGSTTTLLDQIDETDKARGALNRCLGAGYESLALIPLRHGERVIGLLQVNDKRSGQISPRVISLLERLASSLAVGILQRQSAEALRENEAFVKALMDNLPIGIAVNTLDPQVRFSYMNANFSRIYRVAPEDLLEPGRFWDVVYQEPLFRETFRKKVLEDCASGDPDRMRWDDVPLIRKNQETTYISALSAPLPMDGLMISIVWDTTARKLAEEEKIRLQDQLNQAQKIESVGRLAGGVAHDFNNMLGVILGHAELALLRIPPELGIYSHLQEIRKAAQRSADLTRQLLAFARKQNISPAILDLNRAIGSMLKLLRRLIGEEIELVWRPGDGLWPVRMDSSQLDQILANLCVNARDAIIGHGRVMIETGNVTFDERYCIEHAGFMEGDFVLLAVSDNGSGMKREVKEKLFEPFFTTKEFGKGTGLGLSTVFGSVRQNDGFLNVYSEPGMGTSFKIYLPRYWGQAASEKEQASEEAPLGRGEGVMVVEDEKALLKMTEEMLKKQGYAVWPFNSPVEALAMVKEKKFELQLLITDVVMPQMNGRELADQMKRIVPQIEVLFTSGYTANVIAHHGVLDEGVHFLQKPFSMTSLAVKIREILDE